MKNNKLFVLLILVPVFLMCSRNTEKNLTNEQIRETEEALIGANRMLLQKDKDRIKEYMAEHDLSLRETETGLWFEIIKNGNGTQVQDGMLLTIDYKVSLLDGTVCYSSDSLGYKQFRAGKGGIESGLDEGIRMLNEGSEAIFVLPPHLAHGLTGDGDRIPARSVILYYVKLLKVEP
jgi:FKBP-type peptidyl-prolyl cis-trans isomerase FkpA